MHLANSEALYLFAAVEEKRKTSLQVDVVIRVAIQEEFCLAKNTSPKIGQITVPKFHVKMTHALPSNFKFLANFYYFSAIPN